jgi:ABC-type proline/glycine betaine transport system ATPase subunit
MDEANLCDKVALIQAGKILQIDSPKHIVDNFSKSIYAAKSTNMLQLLKKLQQDSTVEHAYPFGEFHHVVMKQHNQTMSPIDDMFAEKILPNIEDVFIDLMRTHA